MNRGFEGVGFKTLDLRLKGSLLRDRNFYGILSRKDPCCGVLLHGFTRAQCGFRVSGLRIPGL